MPAFILQLSSSETGYPEGGKYISTDPKKFCTGNLDIVSDDDLNELLASIRARMKSFTEVIL